MAITSYRAFSHILSYLIQSFRWEIPNSLPKHFSRSHKCLWNFENPKIISKCFNCIHKLLGNYSVNIWEKLMVVSFIVLRIAVEIQPETHQDIFLGQRPKFLDWSCLLFCNLYFTQDPGVTLILKIQLPHLLWKQLDQDFYHNIAEKHGYVCSFTQKCAVSIKISNKWSKGQSWQTLVMVLNRNVSFLWWNLVVKKHRKKTP